MSGDTPNDEKYIYSVGSWKQIPIDSSLNELEAELRKELVNEIKTGVGTEQKEKEESEKEHKHRPPSRKLIRAALAALDESNDSTSSKERPESLYYKIIESRRKQEGLDRRSTYPVALFWELKEFTKAIVKAEFRNRSATGAQLAELAVNDMINSLQNKDPSSLKPSYLDFQLLREDYVRNCLIQQYHEEIDSRIGKILSYTKNPSWEVASCSMEAAIPALDALLIDLQQKKQDLPAPAGLYESNVDYLKMIHNLYGNLLRDRPVISGIDEEGYSLGQMRFALTDHPATIKTLKDWFENNLDRKDKKQLEAAYEQYLIDSENERESGLKQEIDMFLSRRAQISEYLRSYESWDKIQLLVLKDLYKYARDLFDDIHRGDIVPYRYSEYQAPTASSEFISILTKNAHDQIRAAVHEPYRILLAKSYLIRFNLDCANDLSLLVFGFSQELEKLRSSIEKEFLTLQATYPHLPILSASQKTKIPDFITQYQQDVARVFPIDERLSEHILSIFETLDHIDSQMNHFIALSDLLELNCKLVLSHIIKAATEEIKECYLALTVSR